MIDSKQNFVEMCKFVVFVEDEGKVYCEWEEMNESNKIDFDDPNYEELQRKLKKFVELLNEDISLADRDIETDIWNIL